MRVKYSYFLLLSFGFGISSFTLAMEIDSTLTTRVLKTSSTKKTILINRGSKDEITLGMQAKFSSESGVVARGVVVDLSEERSIWSMYRLANPDLVEMDMLLTLKVAEPLKLTQDETKSIVAEKSIPGLTPDRSDQLSLPFENLEVDVPENAIEDGLVSQSELKAEKNFVPLEKFPRLIFFQIALQSLNSSTQAADGTTYKGGLEMTNMMLGLEWYSSKANKWYSKISLSTFFQYHYENILSYEGTVADSRLYEIGGGLHYSFLSPHQSQKFIPSIYVYLAKGQISDAVAGGERSGTAAQEASSVEGDSLAYGLGMGLKYFFPSRLCVQILGEYYNREDTFEADPSTNNNTWSRASNGPRIHLGIGYRF